MSQVYILQEVTKIHDDRWNIGHAPLQIEIKYYPRSYFIGIANAKILSNVTRQHYKTRVGIYE